VSEERAHGRGSREPDPAGPLSEREDAAREREEAIAEGIGLHDAGRRAAEETGPGPPPGAQYLPEPEITRLGRLAHDVRIDLRVLADAMTELSAEPVERRAESLSGIPSSSDPHLERTVHGTTRTVDLSPVAHVDAEGARIGYRASGQGPPLLMLMGFGGVMGAWDPDLVRGIALAGRRVTLIDHRGVGTSAGGELGALTIASMADDAAAVLDALGVGRADVLGWAMGGYVAQELALRHPDRVGSLILAASDAGGPTAVHGAPDVAVDPGEATPEDLLSVSFPAEEEAQRAGRAWLARVAAQRDAHEAWFRMPAEALAAQAAAEGPGWLAPGAGTRDRLDRIMAPTLVLSGAEDPVIHPDNSRLLAEDIPTSILQIYPGAGHAFLFQDPARVATDVADFLRGRLQP
jgi:pimeloyl-ACP methyl ester carboxylesterase